MSPSISEQISDFDALHSGMHLIFGGRIGTDGIKTPPDKTRCISLPLTSCSSRDTSSSSGSPYSAST